MSQPSGEGNKTPPKRRVSLDAMTQSPSAAAKLSKELERLSGVFATSRLVEDAVRAQEATRQWVNSSTLTFLKSHALEAQKFQDTLLKRGDHLGWFTQSDAIERATKLSNIAAIERVRLDWVDKTTALTSSLAGVGSSFEALSRLQENQSYMIAGVGQLSTLSERIQESIKFHAGDLAEITKTTALIRQHFSDLILVGVPPNLLTAAFAAQSLLDNDHDHLAALREESPLVQMLTGLDEQLSATPGELDTGPLATFLEDFLAILVERVATSRSWLERRSLADILELLILILTLVTLYQTHQADLNQSQEAAVTQSEIVKVREAFENGADRFIEALQNSSLMDAPDVFYVVLREVPLTPTRKFRQMRIATLHPNSVVQLVETHGKWIAVAYFDYVLGKPVSGWVLKKYLRRVDRP